MRGGILLWENVGLLRRKKLRVARGSLDGQEGYGGQVKNRA